MAERQRVVVTGLGLVSPLGNTLQASWERMIRGEHGITLLDHPFRYKGEDRVFVAASVKEFSQAILSQKVAQGRTHLSHLYALAATDEALTQSGLWADGKLIDVNPEDIGVKIGTGFGGAAEMTKVTEALRQDSSLGRIYSLIVQPERVATVPSMAFGLQNSASASIAACASGSINIKEAYNMIALGQAEVMAAGSTEALVQLETFAIFNQVRALSGKRNPDFASMPFDIDRDGFVVGEGAGILILENLEHANARGAKILAELIGVAESADALDATAPATDGQIRAMRKALICAELSASDIDYINAHGTSTKEGDKTELESIVSALEGHSHKVPISSFKGQIAHMIGAAASAEVVLALKMMLEGVLIPNVGLHNPLRDDVNLITQLKKRRIDTFMKNSFGFGGINAVLIFRRYIA